MSMQNSNTPRRLLMLQVPMVIKCELTANKWKQKQIRHLWSQGHVVVRISCVPQNLLLRYVYVVTGHVLRHVFLMTSCI